MFDSEVQPSSGVVHEPESPSYPRPEETDGRMGGSTFPENGGDSRQLYPQSSSVLPPMSTTTAMMTSSPTPKQHCPESRNLTTTSPKIVIEDEAEDNIKVDEDEDEKDSSIAKQGSCENLPFYCEVDLQHFVYSHGI